MMTLFRRDDAFITHLRAEVDWYRAQLAYERQRANQAVDELLRLKVGAAPVRPPEPDPTIPKMEQLMNNVEFAQVGAVD